MMRRPSSYQAPKGAPSSRERAPLPPEPVSNPRLLALAGRRQDMCAMRLIVRLVSPPTILLLILLSVALSQKPSTCLAKTVIPVQLGDPDDGDQGPSPGPGKGSSKGLSAQVPTSIEGTLASRPSPRSLTTGGRYLLLASILRHLWR
jgi:hypothetical protein